MVKEIRYTNIRRVLDSLTEHPMLSDLTLEQAVRHVLRFISLHGYTKLYEDKQAVVEIHEWRGLLPCDLISIQQVKDIRTGICLRSMEDTFTPGLAPKELKHHKPMPKPEREGVWNQYIPPIKFPDGEPRFKTQERILFTSFPEGAVEIAYKSIPVDEDGFPLLIDNENYLACLEAYIKKQVFTVKYDQGKIAAGVLENAKKDYAWLSGQLNSEFVLPSQSEMESITRMINTMIIQPRHFDRGFQHLGDREYIRKH